MKIPPPTQAMDDIAGYQSLRLLPSEARLLYSILQAHLGLLPENAKPPVVALIAEVKRTFGFEDAA